MSSITSTLALLEPPPLFAMPSYWEGLKDGGEIVWAARANTIRQFDMKVWEVAGSLRARFRGEFKKLFQNTCEEEENYEYIHGKGYSQVLPSYHCYLISKTEDVADAKAVFVVKCMSGKIAKRTVDILRDDAHITALNLGIDFLAHSDAVMLRTGEQDEDLRSNFDFDEFGSICGCRIIVTADLPARATSTYRQGTLGGIIFLGGTYFAVTSAHILDEVLFDDMMPGLQSGGDSVEHATIQQDESLSDQESDFDDDIDKAPQARSVFQAMYTENLRPESKAYSSRPEAINVRPASGVAKNLVGHFLLQPKASRAHKATPTPSRFVGKSCDWSLTPIVDTRYQKINAVKDDQGRLYTVRSIWSTPDPPEGLVIVLSGVRGPTPARSNGGVAGITFPWSRQIEEVWVVEYDSCQ